MIEMHNNDPMCVVTGSSTHNERIERLWRDVHRSILLFADTFRQMETEGALDPLNEVDMFSLHYVFLPRISRCLSDFQESWNNHSLSSEGNMTPYQLFAEGIKSATELNILTSTSVECVQSGEQDEVHVMSNEPVAVHEVAFSPCTSLVLQLQQTIYPLQSSPDNGKDLYLNKIRLIGGHLLTDCVHCHTT